MPLVYEQDSRLKAITPVLDEHAEWLNRVTRILLYPEKFASAGTLSIPDSFSAWARTAERDNAVHIEVLGNLNRLHNDLRMAADQVLFQSRSRARPDIQEFDTFVALYDEFVTHLRRLEHDMAMSDMGLEGRTGLRSQKVVVQDIEKEMERRSRRGRPFCLALARIDNYPHLKASLSQKDMDYLIIAVAEIIKRCLRSFDDAYCLDNGEFLMCLKQTDMSGGSAGLARLRKLLHQEAPYYMLNGKEKRLTMSSCVAEPEPGDSFNDLMVNIRNDLDRFGGEAGTALEYIEVSPLTRFVHGLEDKGKKTH